MDKVFTKITLFHDLCTITNNDKTDKQLVQIAYLIFNRTRAFVDSLKKWNEKKLEEKTFANFKTHMREEHHALKRVGALTVQDSALYQANLIQQPEFQAKIEEQVKSSLLTAINDFQTEHMESSDKRDPPPLMEANNATTEEMDQTNLLCELIQNLTKQVEAMSKQPLITKSPNINPKTGKPFKRYCWTCGCCDHWGKACPNKKPGHQDSATFKDRKGGSNKDCLPNRD